MLIALGACQQTTHDSTNIPALDNKPVTSPGLQPLDALIQQGITDRLFPGAVCVVGRVHPETGRHEITYAQAYGFITYEPNHPGVSDQTAVSLNTQYDLASVTKLVGTTSAALLALGDGRIALEETVGTYLPEFAEHGNRAITLRQLMTHTSGLPAYASPGVVEGERAADQRPSDALAAHYAKLMPLARPGARLTYSCPNFQILARVVEEACDQPLEDLLEARLFGPLGMRNTTWRPQADHPAGIAPTYRDARGVPVFGTVHDPLARYHQSSPNCPGNAGLYSTAPDLARWCQLILQLGRWGDRQLFNPDLLEQATAIQTDPDTLGEARGLGFDVYESTRYVSEHNARPGHHLVGHSGYTGTLVLIDHHTGVYMVLLTNRTFPADPAAKDQTPSIGAIRAACWQVVREWASGL